MEICFEFGLTNYIMKNKENSNEFVEEDSGKDFSPIGIDLPIWPLYLGTERQIINSVQSSNSFKSLLLCSDYFHCLIIFNTFFFFSIWQQNFNLSLFNDACSSYFTIFYELHGFCFSFFESLCNTLLNFITYYWISTFEMIVILHIILCKKESNKNI